MLGLMQDWQLTVDKVLDHAAQNHGDREIVTRNVEGNITRTTYKALRERAKAVSSALLEHGIKLGDRVATLAWNTERHMEAWYGTMGIGAVLHTINPRLHPDQVAWIANHAEDRILMFDTTFLPLVEAAKDHPSLLVLPLYVPTLIFGAELARRGAEGLATQTPMLMLAGLTLGTCALLPFASAAALRISLR